MVRVSYAGYYASGALLFDGRAVLTAAHLFADKSGKASVTFETAKGTQTVSGDQILLHPDYDPQSNNDLALVWLSTSAPVAADRYSLYRQSDELGKTFTLVGYGKTGTGNTGSFVSSDNDSTLLRLKALNTFDADAATLKAFLGGGLSWSPQANTQLIADFDNGLSTNDALGRLINQTGLGQGQDEGLIAPGDSGGPAFLNGKIAGVASYTASLSQGSVTPDVDNQRNSSFGEIAAWQRMSYFQQWIDQSLRANYPNAPTQAKDVKKEVPEGSSGTSYAFFLVQFTGIRAHANDIVSVDYATRNGTATAGSDYVATSGTLNLYPGEDHAVIPVEIIGDILPEPNETFFLDIDNPVGGSFGPGIVKLTAMRTIMDDDGWSG